DGDQGCKVNSVGSNHSVPSTSISTGSQSSSINSLQECNDDPCSELALPPHEYESTLESSTHHKKDHQYIRDEGGHHSDIRPSPSDRAQAHNYKNRERFATIKSASLVSTNTYITAAFTRLLPSLFLSSAFKFK
ncbi:serine/threonine-protein kinase TAO3, partial [Tachysurus ichikawai]